MNCRQTNTAWTTAGYKMSVLRVMLFACLSSSCTATSLQDLSRRLQSFELLHYNDIIGVSTPSRVKRDTREEITGRPRAIERVTVTASGRRMTLLLTENRDIFGPNFAVTTVKDDGEEVEESFSPQVFYKGVVVGEAQSEVFLHWDSDTALNAKIVTTLDTYYIEPSYPHLPESDNYTMIVYKASNLILHPHSKGSHCAGVKHGMIDPNATQYSESATNPFFKDNHPGRDKREAPSSANTCGLLLVVDTKFLKEIVGGDKARASNYVVDLIARVNSIYRQSSFGGNRGFGFQIEHIKIHDTYSSDPDHYNYGARSIAIVEDAPNPINVLLDAFGRVDKTGNVDYTQYCLAHLFTAYAFKNGVLGLAYIASSSRSTFGGICSKSYYDSALGTQIYLNTGWSSAFNRNKEKILTQEAEIVLAHELGHNWGSEHDPDTATCSPSTAPGQGGKYIMHTYSVNGFQPNNEKFSSCSRSSIGQVLSRKASLCFKEMVSPTKGNFNRDAGEDCDAGPQGDRCCTSGQKYKPGAACSITNDVCCEDCQVKKAKGNLCAIESSLTCIVNSTCDGISRDCKIGYKPRGDYCQNEYGRCMKDNDECVSFPEVIGLNKCPCTDADDTCKLCYRPAAAGSKCVPFDPKDLFNYVKTCKSDRQCVGDTDFLPYMPDKLTGGANVNYITLVDSACAGGYCNAKGVCVRQSTDIVARFWEFLSHLDSNAVVEFMRSNIVGTVAIFSFILWLPCVIVVYCYDKKQETEAHLEDQAFRSMSMRVRKPKDEKASGR